MRRLDCTIHLLLLLVTVRGVDGWGNHHWFLPIIPYRIHYCRCHHHIDYQYYHQQRRMSPSNHQQPYPHMTVHLKHRQHHHHSTSPGGDDEFYNHHSSTTALQATSVSSSLEQVDDEDNRQRAQQQQKQKQKMQWSVAAILASSFLNLLGFTMAGPITPALGKHFDLQVGASFGSLTSAYPFGMLFGLMVWPTLSDRIGRKRIMTASLLGSGLGLVIQSMVIGNHWSLPYFLAARALTGAFAGSSPVSKAYLADIGYKNGKLPRYLAWKDAAATMAFIVGPMMGGILFEFRKFIFKVATTTTTSTSSVATTPLVDTTGSLAFVIGVSAAASLCAAMLVAALVQDVKPQTQQPETTGSNAKIEHNDPEQYDQEKLIACPLGTRMWTGVASVCLVSFLFNIGDSTFHAFFSTLLRDGAGMSAGDIGLLYTLLACISFSVSTTSSGWMMKEWGPVWTCAAGLACVGTGLSALGAAAWGPATAIPPTFAVLSAAAAIYYCGVPLYGPAIPTMLLRCVPSHRRGAIMGLDGAINTIGRIISPLIMGDVYRRYGAGAAFGLAGGVVFGGALTTLFRRYFVLRQAYASSSKPN